MGYTHYFYGLEANQELADFTKEAIKLSDVSIRGGHGDGEPVIEPHLIVFNGDANKDENFETFGICSNPSNDNFCKTDYRPYDKVVTAVLLAAMRLRVPGYGSISSNGNVDDWIESGGVELFVKAYKSLYPNSTPFYKDFADEVAERIGGNAQDLLNVQNKALGLDDQSKLTDKDIETVEKYGWNVSYCKDGTVELESYSPAGEDLVVDVPVADFANEVQKYADDFDPEEHIKMLLDAKNNGFPGVPSLFTLVDDSRAIQKKLNNLADALNSRTDSEETETPLHNESSWMIKSGDVEDALCSEIYESVPELSKQDLQRIARNADDWFRGDDDVMRSLNHYVDEAIDDFLEDYYPDIYKQLPDNEDEEEDED